MYWLLVISLIATVAEITSFVEEHVTEYFDSAIVKESTDIWQKHAIAYQNTLSMAMQETYGFNGMNLYIQRSTNPLYVSKGYYHTDNQVHIVLQDMRLEEFPHISDPAITFPLTSNVIKIEGLVSKMIVHSSYIQFRNTSNIVYDLREQDSFKTSPFLFEQVQTQGQLAIQVEGCKLSGIGITSLTGRSVSLGNAVFRLLHCQYNFEIFSPGVPSPPVIASYSPYTEGLNIDQLIMKPLEGELIPKLQAALHTFVNTSVIFQEKLSEIRFEQEKIFEQTTNYVNNVIRNLNVLTITRNAGKIMMQDFKIFWNDTFDNGEADSVVTLNNMILTGLETVYSSHTGGPFKLTTIKISEELRFGTLQVRGSIDLQLGDKTLGMYDFAAEINDVEVDVTTNIQQTDNDGPARSLHVVEVMGWRSFQFSSPGMVLETGEALITGYLLTKVPIYLTNYLTNVIGDAVREADKEYKMIEKGDKLVLGAPQPGANVDKQDYVDENEVQDVQDNLGNEEENIDEQNNVIEENVEDGEGTISPTATDEDIGEVDAEGFVSPKVITDDPGVDDEGVIEPGSRLTDSLIYQEYEEPDDTGDQLQANFFDENMFADAQNLG